MKKNQIFKGIITTFLITSLISCSNDDDDKSSTCNNAFVPDAEIIAYNGVDETFETNLVSLFHKNINVSDYEVSQEFYQLLGFNLVFDFPVDISDEDEAQGINLPPYELDATIMALNDGFVINLIKFDTLFDDEAPNDDVFDLGLSTLNLKTDNLLSDMAVFDANDIVYTLIGGTEEAPTKISFKDPSGTIIILTEVPTDADDFTGLNSSGETSIYGLFTININVSNLDDAVNFYSEVGFRIADRAEHIATIAMPGGRHITLTESCNTDLPYEDANHLGIARIALETIDIDADVERLNAAGTMTYTPEAVTPSNQFATVRYVAFEDPDGIIIELIERNQ